jgi:hypothetical protein
MAGSNTLMKIKILLTIIGILIAVLILFLLSILYPKIVVASAQVDTLRPVGGGSSISGWIGVPTQDDSALYKNIDDVIMDTLTTYIKTSTPTAFYLWINADITTSNIIDSVVRIAVMKRLGVDLTVVTLRRSAWNGEAWGTCASMVCTLTTTFTTYNQSLVQDPCISGAWTVANINDDLQQWGMVATTAGSRATPYKTQAFIVVYSHTPPPVEAGGGIIQDEDKRGLAEGGIAR